MSDENQNNNGKDYSGSRLIGKLKETINNYGAFHQIHLDTHSPTNKDGTPDKYYKGTLTWWDAATQKYYVVKQLKIVNPKNGMSPSNAQNGYVSFIGIDVNDSYQVQPIE